MRTIMILAALSLGGCGPGVGRDYDDYGGASNDAWLGLIQGGLGMMTYQPARPVVTNCSTFGQMGHGYRCVTQ